MTTDLERIFFDTFGIESKMGCTAYEELGEAKADLICNDYCSECDYFKEVYPQITDRQYLELICAYNNFQNDTASFFIPFDYKNIKNNLLAFLVEEINEKYKNRYFCNDVDKLKHQVQAIFEGEE